MVRSYTTINSNINNTGNGNKVPKYLVKKGLGLGSTQGKILSREEIANIDMSPNIKAIMVGLIL